MEVKKIIIWLCIIICLFITIPSVKADLPNNTFDETDIVNVWIYCMEITNTPCSNATTECEITAFYPNTTSLVEQVKMQGNGTDGFYNYSFGLLVQEGTYQALVYCNNTDEGAISFDFVVGDEGTYDNFFWLYVALWVIPLFLIIISKLTEDKWFAVMSGIILISFGIYLQANGLPNYTNFLIEEAVWTVTLCIGLYFFMTNAIDLAEEALG